MEIQMDHMPANEHGTHALAPRLFSSISLGQENLQLTMFQDCGSIPLRCLLLEMVALPHPSPNHPGVATLLPSSLFPLPSSLPPFCIFRIPSMMECLTHYSPSSLYSH